MLTLPITTNPFPTPTTSVDTGIATCTSVCRPSWRPPWRRSRLPSRLFSRPCKHFYLSASGLQLGPPVPRIASRLRLCVATRTLLRHHLAARRRHSSWMCLSVCASSLLTFKALQFFLSYSESSLAASSNLRTLVGGSMKIESATVQKKM